MWKRGGEINREQRNREVREEEEQTETERLMECNQPPPDTKNNSQAAPQILWGPLYAHALAESVLLNEAPLNPGSDSLDVSMRTPEAGSLVTATPR